MKRILAIGDIHGCCTSLKDLAAFVGFNADDTIITLGDYVDRGPDSKGVIDFLIQLKSDYQVHCLRGNHEIMMEKSRDDASETKFWKRVGGDATLESYGTNSLESIPLAHWEFLDSLLPYLEAKDHFFVHANAYPDAPLENQPDYMLYWERLHSPQPHSSGKTMICGHTSQKSGVPLNFGHTVCIDTFAHGGGWLTCLDVCSGKFWQTNEKGERFADVLEFEAD